MGIQYNTPSASILQRHNLRQSMERFRREERREPLDGCAFDEKKNGENGSMTFEASAQMHPNAINSLGYPLTAMEMYGRPFRIFRDAFYD